MFAKIARAISISISICTFCFLFLVDILLLICSSSQIRCRAYLQTANKALLKTMRCNLHGWNGQPLNKIFDIVFIFSHITCTFVQTQRYRDTASVSSNTGTVSD